MKRMKVYQDYSNDTDVEVFTFQQYPHQILKRKKFPDVIFSISNHFFNINWTDLQIFEKFYTHIMVRPQENYLFSERLLCTVRSFAINLSISVWTQSQTNQCWCFCFCFVEGNTETFNLSREKIKLITVVNYTY